MTIADMFAIILFLSATGLGGVVVVAGIALFVVPLGYAMIGVLKALTWVVKLVGR